MGYKVSYHLSGPPVSWHQDLDLCGSLLFHQAAAGEKPLYYTSIRRKLKEPEAKSVVIYPSMLKVFTKNGIQLCTTAAEVLQDLISKGLIKSNGSELQVQVKVQ